jgi:hypothetical protein
MYWKKKLNFILCFFSCNIYLSFNLYDYHIINMNSFNIYHYNKYILNLFGKIKLTTIFNKLIISIKY